MEIIKYYDINLNLNFNLYQFDFKIKNNTIIVFDKKTYQYCINNVLMLIKKYKINEIKLEINDYFEIKRFNNNGNIIYSLDSNNNWEKWIYLGNNLFLYENSDKYWNVSFYNNKNIKIFDYNSNSEYIINLLNNKTNENTDYEIYFDITNNIFYYKNKDYDYQFLIKKFNNKIFYLNSLGIWNFYKFDDNGNIILFKNSLGYLIA